MTDSSESTISTSLRLMKALSLARQGKLKPAQLLLAPESAIPESTLELHALAALVTHEGDHERALRLWRLLLQRQPDHSEARRMIPVIELWQSRPAWYRFVPIGAAILGAIVLGVFLIWVLGSPAPKAKPALVPAPVRTAPAASSPAPVPITPVKPAPAKNQRVR